MKIVRVRGYSRKGTYISAHVKTGGSLFNGPETFLARYAKGGKAGRSRAIVFGSGARGTYKAVSYGPYGPMTHHDSVTRSSQRRISALAGRIERRAR